MSKFMLSSAAATSHKRYLLHIAKDGKSKCGKRIVLAVFVDKIIRDEPRLGLCRQCGTEDEFIAIENGVQLLVKEHVKEHVIEDRRTWNQLVSLRPLMLAYHRVKKQNLCTYDMLWRALGIAMNRSTELYQDHWRTVGHELPFQHFSQSACSCKGSIHNKMCKHKIAARLLDTAIEIEGEYLALQRV